MRSFRWSLFALFAVVLCNAAPALAEAPVPFMGMDEVRTLLARGPVCGSFTTVAEGATLSQYPFCIKGIQNVRGIDVIIFTTPRFIAAGMSGSPAYVRGIHGRIKLVGAIAYFMSPFAVSEQWGGIAPIECMKLESDAGMRGGTPASLPTSFLYRGKLFMPIALGTDPIPEDVIARSHADPDTAEILRHTRLSVSEAASSARAAVPAPPRLKAGMTIVADLVEWRDPNGKVMTASATGTITFVGPDGQVYAFGHPFLRQNKVQYQFRTARIMGIVASHDNSYKMVGDKSPVLGRITYDGDYGIYGVIGGMPEGSFEPISITFRINGGPAATYQMRLCQTHSAAIVMTQGLDALGDIVRVPPGGQPSTVVMTATIPIVGHAPITFTKTYTSSRYQFGPNIIYKSSYEDAYEEFIEKVYAPLLASTFNFSLRGLELTFSFTDGVQPNLCLAALAFPSKITFGTDPALEFTLVGKENQVALSRRVEVPIPWDMVEEPTYTAETKSTEKQAEKKIEGALSLYTEAFYPQNLPANDREREFPPYFLNAEDYLNFFRKELERTSNMLFVKFSVRKRTGRSSPVIASEASAAETQEHPNENGWQVSREGLQTRKTTVQEEDTVTVVIALPPVPGQYQISAFQRDLPIEVVAGPIN